MFKRRLAVVIGGIWLALVESAWAEEAKPAGTKSAAPVGAEEVGQVKVYRLRHADAASLVEELSVVLDSRRIKLVAYPTGNSIVVAGPSSVQGAMARLMARLDAPPPSNGVGAKSPPGAADPPGAPPDKGAAPQAGETASKAPSAEPAAEGVIRVIRVPNRDLAALAQALSEAARTRNASVRTVVVTPSGEEIQTHKASQPMETKRR